MTNKNKKLFTLVKSLVVCSIHAEKEHSASNKSREGIVTAVYVQRVNTVHRIYVKCWTAFQKTDSTIQYSRSTAKTAKCYNQNQTRPLVNISLVNKALTGNSKAMVV